MNNIDEAAEKYALNGNWTIAVIGNQFIRSEAFKAGALSDAAKQHWYEVFKTEQKQADEIVNELAEWSLRYPRSMTYSSSRQPQMDGELIALEERAKKWLETNKTKEER